VPPLGGTPRLPALHGRLPRRGPDRWTSKTLHYEPLTSSRPFRGEVAATLLTARDQAARFRVGCIPADSRQPGHSDLPLRGSDRWWALLLPGGPTLLGFSTSSKSARRCRLEPAHGLYAFRTVRPYERFTSGETPRYQDASDPS